MHKKCAPAPRHAAPRRMGEAAGPEGPPPLVLCWRRLPDLGATGRRPPAAAAEQPGGASVPPAGPAAAPRAPARVLGGRP